MSVNSSSRFHGGVRGAELSRGSLLFGGPFGRMFRALPPADFGTDDIQSEAALKVLAAKMLAIHEDSKNGPDPEERGISAVYTYLGQFIDHDLTFDPASSLQKQNDPDALVDYRTPRFDLDNVYGRGPDDQPYLFEDGKHFILGKPLNPTGTNTDPHDLPRSVPHTPGAQHRAIIGDPRNDENTIVSQLQGLFLKFHNKMVDTLGGDFAAAQREVRFHYQWIILNDFLPTLIDADVLAEVLPHIKAGTDVVRDPPRLRFYKARDEAYMPLEFAAAAYRFGHSMVRPEYQLNLDLDAPFPIFAGSAEPGTLRGFRALPKNHAIDWRLFVDLEPLGWGDAADQNNPNTKKRTQRAYKIDTSLVNPLGNLPPDIAADPSALALRNLERGWRMRLPSGQAVAKAMGIKPLADSDILIGKFTGDPADTLVPIDHADFKGAFVGNCPLWTYVLAETIEKQITIETTEGVKQQTARLLGEVGGRIVAETMVGILLADSSSFLAQDPRWTPMPALTEAGVFGVRELIKAAL